MISRWWNWWNSGEATCLKAAFCDNTEKKFWKYWSNPKNILSILQGFSWLHQWTVWGSSTGSTQRFLVYPCNRHDAILSVRFFNWFNPAIPGVSMQSSSCNIAPCYIEIDLLHLYSSTWNHLIRGRRERHAPPRWPHDNFINIWIHFLVY